MASSRSLILAFIDRRPATAGRALAAMEPGDAAALLEDIPARYATRVLTHMGAWSAVALLTRMSVDKAAGALGGFPYQGAAAVLRLMPPGTRERILAELPAPIRKDFNATLSFPADTVGAHMTTAVLVQREDETASDAVAQARRAPAADAGCIMVVDADHRLAGVLAASALLRTPGSTRLTELMDRDVEPVSARARVATVRDLEAWDRYTSLPVVSRRKHVIGTLTHAALRQALASEGAHPAGQGMAAALADAFSGYLSGLAGLAGGDPGRTRPGGEEANR